MKNLLGHGPILVPLLLTILAYLPSMQGEFVTDDIRLMSTPFRITSFHDLFLSLKTGYGFDPINETPETIQGNLHSFRPIQVTLLLLEKTFFGEHLLFY